MVALSPLSSPLVNLAAIGEALAAIPVRYLLPGHCLAVVEMVLTPNVALQQNFMASYYTGLLAAFGGGIVTALLLQDPRAAPIALLADNAVGVAYTAAWWGLLYAPPLIRGPLRRALACPPIRAACRACMNALRASLVVARVDLAVDRFPGVAAAPLLLGTLAGCGGKVLTDAAVLPSAFAPPRAARGGGGGGGGARTEFAVPGLAMRSAAAGAALHWLAAHVTGALTPRESAAAVALLFIGHGLAVDATARPLDYTAAPAAALHWVAGVPMPGGGGGGGRPAGRARAASQRKRA